MTSWRNFVMGRQAGFGEHRPFPSFPWPAEHWVARLWCSCGVFWPPMSEEQAQQGFADHLRRVYGPDAVV